MTPRLRRAHPGPLGRHHLLLLLAWVCLVPLLVGQPRGRLPAYQQPVDPLRSQQEAATFLRELRGVGIRGDFRFSFTLEHLPRRGAVERYTGQLEGRWLPGLRQLSLEFTERGEAQVLPAQLWTLAGIRDALWLRPAAADTPQALSAEDSLEPLGEGLVLTPFDLQMPFLEWPTFIYEGADKFRSRPVHSFLLLPPGSDRARAVQPPGAPPEVTTEPPWPGLGGVRIRVDADFYALLEAEVLDASGEVIRRWRASRFREVDGQWLVQTLEVFDTRTRDKTRLQVEDVELGLALPEAAFYPEPAAL